jgi:hypothetical protein
MSFINSFFVFFLLFSFDNLIPCFNAISCNSGNFFLFNEPTVIVSVNLSSTESNLVSSDSNLVSSDSNLISSDFFSVSLE